MNWWLFFSVAFSFLWVVAFFVGVELWGCIDFLVGCVMIGLCMFCSFLFLGGF